MNKILMQITRIFASKSVRTVLPVANAACLVALSGCSALGNSQSDEQFRHRIYVGAGVLVSQLEPDTSGVEEASVEDSVDSGGSLVLGYDVNRRFSMEGHLASLGEAVIEPAGTIGYSVGGISALYYGFNNAGDRARRSGFAVFGRLGVGTMNNDASGVKFERINDIHLLAGVGLEYDFSQSLGMRAEIVAHETDARYAQLGLVFRFGTQQGRPWEVIPGSVESSLLDDVAIVDPVVEELPPAPTPIADAEPVVKLSDALDQCADTAANVPGKTEGCPIFGGVVDGINFRAGSDILMDEAVGVLADIAQTLRENPEIRIIIEAHTDNRGEAADNLQLSKRRAIAVARYLIGAGISGSRLRPQAYGESRPRTTNLTAQGRAANRRVEISVYP